MTASRSSLRLVVVAAVCVVAAAYLLLWRPRANELSSVRHDTTAMSDDLLAIQASAAANHVTTTAPSTDSLSVAVPPTPDLANLLRRLQDTAAAAGVSQNKVSPAPASANASAPGAAVEIDISASGPRAALSEYLHRLSTLERLFVVDKADLAPATAAGDTSTSSPATGTYQLDVTGRAFTSAIGPANG